MCQIFGSQELGVVFRDSAVAVDFGNFNGVVGAFGAAVNTEVLVTFF